MRLNRFYASKTSISGAKKKRKQKHPESDICKALWHWFFYRYPQYRKRYLRIEVGGQRTKKTQGILKAEGCKAGVSDIFIALPKGGYAGLWLEVKVEKGRLSVLQKEFHEEMKDDYQCVTAYGLHDCKALIESYMQLDSS